MVRLPPFIQLQAVRIPDVDPFDLPEEGRFSMAAGDFLEVYSEPGKDGTEEKESGEQWGIGKLCKKEVK